MHELVAEAHTFLQLLYSLLIQMQLLFAHHLPPHQGRLPYVPRFYRSHVKAQYALLQWFINNAPSSRCLCK